MPRPSLRRACPTIPGPIPFVRNGAFATCGVNYTELGAHTADMALEVLQTGVVPEHHVMDGGIITVNTETAAALGARLRRVQRYGLHRQRGETTED
ncbi:MAG: hypothetical protein ACLSAF_20030 [Intestinimonas sp.]